MRSGHVKSATFTVYSNDTGKEVRFTVDNPTYDQIKLVGDYVLVTQVEIDNTGGEDDHPMSPHICPGPPECM